MPFEFDSMLAWMLFTVVMIVIGGSFIFDSVRQKTIAQREKEAQQEKEQKEKEQQQLRNDIGDEIYASLNRAALENKNATTLSTGAKSSQVTGPHVTSEVGYEKKSAYTIKVYMEEKTTTLKECLIIQIDINTQKEDGKQIRVCYFPFVTEEFFPLETSNDIIRNACEVVRTYRHFRRSTPFVRSGKNTR